MISDSLNSAVILFLQKYATNPEIHVNDIAYQALNMTSVNGIPIQNDIPSNPSECSVMNLVNPSDGTVINVYVWG